MRFEFAINGKTQPNFYVGFTPAACTLRILDVPPGTSSVTITLRNIEPASGGKLVFYADRNNAQRNEISLQLPGDGSTVSFFIAGSVPSINDGDAGISILQDGHSVESIKMMVRVRKNANTLTPAERDRFLTAYVRLVEIGKYKTFLDMHDAAADHEIHGRASFLPWHRIYILDLERHLQEIDSSVTLPYWDFQHPAPNVFSRDFMGEPISGSVGTLQFNPRNPLNRWVLPGLPTLERIPDFVTQSDKANVEPFEETLTPISYDWFANMELDPHGSAHVSFSGPIASPPTAPQDPLFFMLHCNVDRLWATWQSMGSANTRFDSNTTVGYNPQSRLNVELHRPAFPPRIGDFLADTLWPWNRIHGRPRPATAPGGSLIDSPFTPYPGNTPKVADTVDYQGRLTNQPHYADYDTIPFRNITPATRMLLELSTDAQRTIALENLAERTTKKRELNKIANQSFLEATENRQLVQSLSDATMLSGKENIDKALNLLRDNNADTGARILALSRLTRIIAGDEELIRYVLSLLSDTNNPGDLRKAAMRTIRTISFGSPLYTALKPDIIQSLRGRVSDPNLEIRENSIRYLAELKDEYVQRELVNGLENPSQAKVPEELAVHLLGYDLHAGLYPLLEKVVQKSANNQSRAEALHLLGSDPASKDLLKAVFENKKERFNVRKNSLLALQQHHPDEFKGLAQSTVINEQENESLRALSIQVLDNMPAELSSNNESSFLERLKAIATAALPAILATSVKSYLSKRSIDKE